MHTAQQSALYLFLEMLCCVLRVTLVWAVGNDDQFEKCVKHRALGVYLLSYLIVHDICEILDLMKIGGACHREISECPFN